MIKMKIVLSTILAGVLLAGLRVLAADTNAASVAALGNPVIAHGNGIEIKRGELDEEMTGIRNAYQRQNQTLSPAQVIVYEKQILNQLIDTDILLAKATDADKAAGQKAADLQLTGAIENAGSQETFDQRLNANGMTETGLRAKLTQTATAQAVLERELNVSVTDDEVKAYYDTHTFDYEQPEMARVSHILIFTVDPVTHAPLPGTLLDARLKLSQNLVKAARAGTDFAKLAKQYSEDPGSKDNGGELISFPRGLMAPEIESAAFSMTNNQVSDVITTSIGYQIVKLLEKIPSKKTSYLAAIADIKQGLIRQKFAQLAPPYVDGLRKAAGVEILDPNLKATAATNGANVSPSSTPPAG
jgi:foldase protein PrsA